MQNMADTEPLAAPADRLLVQLEKFAGAWVSRPTVGSSEVYFIRKSSLRDPSQWAALCAGSTVSLRLKRSAGRSIVTDAVLET